MTPLKSAFAFGLLASAAIFQVPRVARAWDSPDHEAAGRLGFLIGCAKATAGNVDPLCSDAAMVDLVGFAIADPDHCHSAFHSETGSKISSASAGNCKIQDGVDGQAFLFFNQSRYVVSTNENHFGDNTFLHYAVYHQIAVDAATRYQRGLHGGGAAGPLLQCKKAALGIEGFADHYLTDRTAAGHGWNAQPRYTTTSDNSRMDGMRGCIHGQGYWTTQVLNYYNSFDCVQHTESLDHIGLWRGAMGARFGDAWAGTGAWGRSDGDFPVTTFLVDTQIGQTVQPTADSFADIIRPLVDNGPPSLSYKWNRTLVESRDMCKTAFQMCCHDATTWTETVTVSGPNTYVDENYVFDCNYCNPDMPQGKILAYCNPVDVHGLPPNQLYPQLNPPPYTRQDDAAPVKVDINFTSNVQAPHTYSQWQFYFQIAPYGGATGTYASAALGTFPGGYSVIHPDAQWNLDNDILTKLGCPSFLADTHAPVTAAAQVPAANANGWNNSAVTVNLDAVDPEVQGETASGVQSITYSKSGAETLGYTVVAGSHASTSIAHEGATTVRFTATDKAGNVEGTKLFVAQLDFTPPQVAYVGNQGTYYLDSVVKIQCAVTDALSGVATTDCVDINQPAYLYNPGVTTAINTATDKAGNIGTGTLAFTLVVTPIGLGRLTQQLVTNVGVGKSMFTKLLNAAQAAQRNDNPSAQNMVGAYINEVQAQIGKSITADNAAILIRLASGLTF